MKFLKEIIIDVKNKKELRQLDDVFVEKKISEFFGDKHGYQYKEKVLGKISESKLYKQFSKSREHDFLIKSVRTELRKVYGAFILENYGKREKILAKLSKEDMDSHEKLLMMHKSTNERMDHIKKLYELIISKLDESLDKKQYVILDLACGLNPISSIYYIDRIKKYYASDISSEDCEFLSKYFEKIPLDNECFQLDLADEKNYLRLEKIKADVCYLFKSLDGLERVKRNITERLLKAINTTFFVVTFPTLSLGGVRTIKEHRRLWFENILDKLEWKWDKRMLGSELVYWIAKK